MSEQEVTMRSLLNFTAVLIMLALSCKAEFRTWTSQQGTTIEAEFVKAENGRVWLTGRDGKLMNVAFNVLVAEDQTLVNQLYNEMQEKATAERNAATEAAARSEAEKRSAMLEKWKPGQIASCTTTNKTQASYHVYIPSSFSPDKPPALVYAFSPSGNGRGQLNSMKESAEKYGWIVIGIDKVKNGMEEGELRKEAIEIVDSIIADVQALVPHNPKLVYLSGMSGGAMESYQLAARRPELKFAGVLAFGGWLGGQEFQKTVKFQKGGAAAMINGDSDKNANAWTESDGDTLKRFNWTVKVFQFPGGHAMAPPEAINEAIEWIQKQPLPK